MRNDGTTQMIVVCVWLAKDGTGLVKMRKWEETGWWMEWDDEGLTYDKLISRTSEVIKEQAYKNVGTFIKLSITSENEDSSICEDTFCENLKLVLSPKTSKLRVSSNGRLIIFHP